MGVIKAKCIEYDKIQLSSPKPIIDGKNFTFNLKYDTENDTLMIQLPRCQLFTGLFETDGKCFCELAVPQGGVTSELYSNIANRVQFLLKAQKRFHNMSFSSHLRATIDNFACLRVKIPQMKSKIMTDIVSTDNEPLSFSEFKKGITVIPIVTVEHVYVINNRIGFNMLLKQVVLL